MFTTAAYETTGSLAALTAITPVPDPTLAIIGNDIRVPVQLPNLMCALPMINSAAGGRMQMVSPSLRALVPFDLSPIQNGLIPGNGFFLVPFFTSPVPLVGLEPLDTLVSNGAAVVNRNLIWLSDGAPKATTGKQYTIRATATASLVTATWVNSGALTFASTLPTGHYQVVGFRSISANQVAGRIFFVGYPWRPGVPAMSSDSVLEAPYFRYGNMGVWGEFDNTVPPTVDFLGVTDTAQSVFLDLIKTS